jgi:hypothetical protein
MPAILIETGFINNYEDERYLNSDEGQQELADGIAAAVKRYKVIVESGNIITNPVTPDKVEKEPTPDEKYSSRTKNILRRLDIKQPNFKVDLYDDGDVDGDIVSVYYNGKVLLSNKKLTEKALTLNLTADPNKTENELLIYAENEGAIPPNTALMVVTEGNNRTEVRITSDEKKNGVVIFSKK